MGVGPDWTTIPSYLQAKLRGDRIDGKSVRVYNFGRGAYFSTQERVLFQQLLLSKIRPDAAIFLDGLNDPIDGRPYTWQLLEQTFATPKRRPWIHAVVDRLTQSPMGRAAAIIRDRYSPETPLLPTFKPEPSSRPELDGVIDRYIEHKRQVEAISCAYGIRPFFVWQPVPGYKYDLKYHIALDPTYGLGKFVRSGEIYAIAAERRAEFGKSFLWLADIRTNLKEPLYMDAVRYNAKFSELIAARIATFLLEEIDSKQERCNSEISQARLQNK